MEIETTSKLLTVHEVMIILHVSHNTVYKLIRENKLKAFRLGRDGKKSKYNRRPWRIKEGDLAELIMKGHN